MFEQLFTSLSPCGVELSSAFLIADHFITVGCALTALFSDPDTPPDAPPQPLTTSQYRHAIQCICPGRRFADVAAELIGMPKILEAEFAEGLRQAAEVVRAFRSRLLVLIRHWNSMDLDTRGLEPPAVGLARDGVTVATSILQSVDNAPNVADDTTCGKLALLVIEKVGQMDLLECSKVNRDATFKATHHRAPPLQHHVGASRPQFLVSANQIRHQIPKPTPATFTAKDSTQRPVMASIACNVSWFTLQQGQEERGSNFTTSKGNGDSGIQAEGRVIWPAYLVAAVEQQNYERANVPPDQLHNPLEGEREEEEEPGMVPDVVVNDEDMGVDMDIDVVSIRIPSDLQMLQDQAFGRATSHMTPMDDGSDDEIDVVSVIEETDIERLRSRSLSRSLSRSQTPIGAGSLPFNHMRPHFISQSSHPPEDRQEGPSSHDPLANISLRSSSCPLSSHKSAEAKAGAHREIPTREPGLASSSGIVLPLHDRSKPFTAVDMIGQLQVSYDAIRKVLIWDSDSEDYCLREVYERDMLSAPTISALVLHLCALRLLSNGSETADFALGIPTNLPWGLIPGSNTEGVDDQLQVLGGLFPKRILLPVVDRAASHCYLWYIVASEQGDRNYQLNAQLIDSLSGSQNPTVRDMRANPIPSVVERFYPGCKFVLKCSTMYYSRFQQDPQSNDCGYYLAQAVSAALFNELDSLNDPLPVESILVRIANKLTTHWGGEIPLGADILHALATEGSEPLHRRSRKSLPPPLVATSEGYAPHPEVPPSFLPPDARPLSAASPAPGFHLHDMQGEAWPTETFADDRPKSKAGSARPNRRPPAGDDEWHPDNSSSDGGSCALDLDPNNLYEEIMDLGEQPAFTFPEGGTWRRALTSFLNQANQKSNLRSGIHRINLENKQFNKKLMTCLSGYFWFSAAAAVKPYRTLLLDPLALDVLRQEESASSSPANRCSTRLPDSLLWHRQELWSDFGQNKNLLALDRACIGPSGEQSWYFLQVDLLGGRAAFRVFASQDVDKHRLQASVGSLSRRLTSFFGLPNSHGIDCRMAPLRYDCDENLNTDSRNGLVVLYYLCQKLLAKDGEQPNLNVFFSSLQSFYKAQMIGPNFAPRLPWRGLCGQDRVMYGHREYQEVPQWRLYNEPASSTVQSDIEHVYGPRGLHVFAPGSRESKDFFRELLRTRSAFQEDMLFGVAGRSFDDLEQALLLRAPDHATGRSLPSHQFGERVERDRAQAYSLEELVERFTDEEGSLTPTARRALLTGTVSSQNIVVDWLKDQEHLNPDWFLASTDVDSLSLTVIETEISDFVSLYPYPDRAMSLNVSNNLWVNVSPGRRVLMHQCPNACMGTLGSNGQFRWLVFWPNRMEQTVSRRYRNYVNEEEGTVWYDDVFLRALHIAQLQAPLNIQPLVINTIRALPKSYRMAEIQCTGGGPRSFLRFKVPPQVINLMLPIMRHLVNTTPSLASYRDYFFHFCGINLKAVELTVQGQCDNNPLDNVFKMYNILPWHRQNPHNIMVDVGLELALDPERLPYRKPETTMIWRQFRLYGLWKDIWEQQRWDDYLHSSTVGGFAAGPAFPMDCGMVKLQCYMKDKGMTYVHSDRSVGTNFSVKDVLHRTEKYYKQLSNSVETWESDGLFGVRTEWRCTPWAAQQMLAKDPQIWVDRFHSNGAIVCHKTRVVSGYKIMMLNVYKETFERLQRLEATENVKLLACATAYLLRGLTKRPDSMSSSVQMAKGLGITERAVTYGLASIHPDFLDKNRTSIHLDVDCTEYNILRHADKIRPGGQRIKGVYQVKGLPRTLTVRGKPSEAARRQTARHLSNGRRGSPTSATPSTMNPVNDPKAPHRTTTAPSASAVTGLSSSDWMEADQETMQEIFENLLPNWLWGRFPKPRLRQPQPKQAFRIKRQPLTQAQFQRLVAEDTKIHARQRGESGFTKVVDQLFPTGWKLGQASLNSTMQSYDQVCLQRIRDWIRTRPREQQSEFSRAVRTRIQLALRSWEFLPAIQKDVVWSTTKVSGIKQFAVYMNPDFAR